MNNQLSIFYSKNKPFILSGTFLLFAFFIVFQVIFPQISFIFSLQEKISARSEEASALQISLDSLASLDEDQLTKDFTIVNSALPTVKDIGGMFSALNSAAGRSSVTVRGFSLKVGKLFGEQTTPQTSTVGVPYLTVSAKVTASDSRDFIVFLSELQKIFPITEVKSMNAEASTANFEINFYYQPLDIKALAKQEKIVPLTKSEELLLNQLREWESQSF
jgi:hypothetical protein